MFQLRLQRPNVFNFREFAVAAEPFGVFHENYQREAIWWASTGVQSCSFANMTRSCAERTHIRYLKRPWTYVQGTELSPFPRLRPQSSMGTSPILSCALLFLLLGLPPRIPGHLWPMYLLAHIHTQWPRHRAGEPAESHFQCARTISTALQLQKHLPPPTQIPLLSLLFCPSSMTTSLCLVVWQSLVPYTPETQRNTLAFLPGPAMKSSHCVLLGRGRQGEGWNITLGLRLCKTLCFSEYIGPKLWQKKQWPWGKKPQGHSLLLKDQGHEF